MEADEKPHSMLIPFVFVHIETVIKVSRTFANISDTVLITPNKYQEQNQHQQDKTHIRRCTCKHIQTT